MTYASFEGEPMCVDWFALEASLSSNLFYPAARFNTSYCMHHLVLAVADMGTGLAAD